MSNTGIVIKRDLSLDVLRIISMICVILIHITSFVTNVYDVADANYVIGFLINGLLRWSVPIFFMISGALTLRSNTQINISFLKKRLVWLLTCIVTWGLFYAVLDDLVFNHVSLSSIPRAFISIVSGTAGYHLWFLYSLTLIHLVVPFIKTITSTMSSKYLFYLLLLWFIFVVSVNSIELLCQDFPFFRVFNFSYDFPLLNLDLGYFVLGHYLYEHRCLSRGKSLTVFLMSLMLIFLLNYFFVSYMGVYPVGFSNPDGILTFVAAFGLFTFIGTFSNIDITPRVFKHINKISSHSFGVYIVHVFWITFIFRILKLRYDLFGATISSFVWLIVIFTLSILTVETLKRIKFLNKII